MFRKTVLALAATVLMFPAVIAFAGGDEDMDSESRDADTGLIDFLKNVSVGIYIDMGYEYNFNNPKSGENAFRSLDPDHNEFELHMAQLSLEKTPTGNKTLGDYIGFRIDLSFGEDAERIHAGGLGEDDQPFDLTQAYINILAPIGNGLNIYAGKFVTLAGFEVIEAKGNPNITRSFLFGLAIPFTHTGIRLAYATGPVTLTVGLNNGWDVVDDNNDGKTIETQIALELERASFYLTGYFGPEDDGVDSDWRELITFVGSVTPVEPLTLSFDLDFGWEQDFNFEAGQDDAFWWGIAGYVVYEISPVFSMALRGEFFDDNDGVRTGFEQQMWEITPTLSIKPFAGRSGLENLEFRVEYRHDQSNEDVFEDSDGDFKDTQDTIAFQLLYYFST